MERGFGAEVRLRGARNDVVVSFFRFFLCGHHSVRRRWTSTWTCLTFGWSVCGEKPCLDAVWRFCGAWRF